MTYPLKRSLKNKKLLTIINRIFPPACVVVIKGDWKTGKTDFALKLAEYLLRLKKIKKFASNIYIDPIQVKSLKIPYRFISSIPNLKRWGIPPTGDNKSKLFIYDEAVSSSPSRRAMSKLNTEWLKLIPELSKGRMKLIVCVHTTKYMDSVFLDLTYLRGVFHKSARKKGEQIVKSYATLAYPKILNRNSGMMENPGLICKRTHFKFDPYRIATMQTEETADIDFDERLKILVDYAFTGKSFSKIGREKKLYPMQVRREFITALKFLLQDKINQDYLAQQASSISS